MANLNGFNASEVEPATSFEPLPAGKYVAAIVASEQKPTKNGVGQYLELQFEILEGPYKGRFVWHRLCLQHPNIVTTQIARGQLSALCRCVGVMQPRDSTEIHNLPVVLVVKVKNRKDTNEPTNEVRNFEKYERNSQAPQATTNPVAGNPYANTTPPWKR